MTDKNYGAKEAAYRKMMEDFIIQDFTPMGNLIWRQYQTKRAAFEKKVKAMTMKQLVHEFDLRDGPEWLDSQRNAWKPVHCSTKLDKDGHPI